MFRRHQLMEQHGLPLRDDSKICEAYIKRGLEAVSTMTAGKITTIEKVAKRWQRCNFCMRTLIMVHV